MRAHENDYPLGPRPTGGIGSNRGGAANQGLLYRVAHLSIHKLVAMLLVVFLVVSVIAHSLLTGLDGLGGGGLAGSATNSRSQGALHGDPANSLTAPDLHLEINQLRAVKASVNRELLELEAQLQRLKADIRNHSAILDEVASRYERSRQDLEQMTAAVEQKRQEHLDLDKRYTPRLALPHPLLPEADPPRLPPPSDPGRCRLHSCFDYSRCSLTSQFPVYFYDTKKYSFRNHELRSFIKTAVTHAFLSSPYTTHDPTIACVYVVLLDVESVDSHQLRLALQKHINTLTFWGGDGRNHILLNVARSYSNGDIFADIDTGRAMVAQSSFTDVMYRRDYDVIIPPSLGKPDGDVWMDMPLVVPAKRKHLLSFQGSLPILSQQYLQKNKPKLYSNQSIGEDNFKSRKLQTIVGHVSVHNDSLNIEQSERLGAKVKHSNYVVEFEQALAGALKQMQAEYPADNFLFQFSCDSTDAKLIESESMEWALCGPAEHRYTLLTQSTFALILAPPNTSVISTTILQVRLYEALRFGAVPVIIGNYMRLPFEDLLPWKRAVIVLPKARVTELHFLLRSISDADILEYRRQGRLLWETHLATTKSIVDTLLATVRVRLNLPAKPSREEPSPSVFNASFTPIREEMTVVDPGQPEGDDFLGVVESPFPSPRFMRNFTQQATAGGWAPERNPLTLYPSSPFLPVLPNDAQFNGSEFGFRPIGDGLGGAGKEFSESLGGDWPREQFTIVMLTYEREAVLMNALARLRGMPHLHKVLVVWNSPALPVTDLRWPIIHVPIHVVRTKKNSLNNRFLPYDAIETEAVLSIDDDAHLRHDEIIFGFRVWRENRDRLVGFPGRYHSWDAKMQSWYYNSNYSCELSMVLTGAAFFHKYYAFLYSYVQPQAIRDVVDQYLNCEDLAMNFLVSHVTRKPPIKVTSRWTFRCPGCPVALSVDEEHFRERHKCINQFVRVYGYMPLLHTQVRVDSVLFKTRIPHEKQKCFKYI